MAQRTRSGRGRSRPSPAGPRSSEPTPRTARPAPPRRAFPFLRRQQEPENRRRAQGRYTAPTPRQVRHSPRWYPWLLLGLAIFGVAVIIANYASALPHSPTNWYTLVALIALLSSAMLATRYR